MPDPYTVVNYSEARHQVVTYGEIVRYVRDEEKRKSMGTGAALGDV